MAQLGENVLTDDMIIEVFCSTCMNFKSCILH